MNISIANIDTNNPQDLFRLSRFASALRDPVPEPGTQLADPTTEDNTIHCWAPDGKGELAKGNLNLADPTADVRVETTYTPKDLADAEAALCEEAQERSDATDAAEAKPKKKRKRRTKAQIASDKAAEEKVVASLEQELGLTDSATAKIDGVPVEEAQPEAKAPEPNRLTTEEERDTSGVRELMIEASGVPGVTFDEVADLMKEVSGAESLSKIPVSKLDVVVIAMRELIETRSQPAEEPAEEELDIPT